MAGDRVLANPKPTWNEPKRPQQLHATVLKVNNRTKKNGGPCVQVVHDTGRNGAGRIECFPPSSLVALRRLRLRDIFSTSSEPAPPPPYEWFADPPRLRRQDSCATRRRRTLSRYLPIVVRRGAVACAFRAMRSKRAARQRVPPFAVRPMLASASPCSRRYSCLASQRAQRPGCTHASPTRSRRASGLRR